MNPVDSSAWLAYFAGAPNARFFAGFIEDAEALLVPSVCLYEVFKVVLRERGENAAVEAAALELEEDLPFADSVIHAVGEKRDATLGMWDAHFREKPGVKFGPKSKGR